MHILFAIFGVQNQEILIKEGLYIKELRTQIRFWSIKAYVHFNEIWWKV